MREYERLAPQPCQMVNAIRLRLITNNTLEALDCPVVFVCSEAAWRSQQPNKSKCLRPNLSQQAL